MIPKKSRIVTFMLVIKFFFKVTTTLNCNNKNDRLRERDHRRKEKAVYFSSSSGTFYLLCKQVGPTLWFCSGPCKFCSQTCLEFTVACQGTKHLCFISRLSSTFLIFPGVTVPYKCQAPGHTSYPVWLSPFLPGSKPCHWYQNRYYQFSRPSSKGYYPGDRILMWIPVPTRQTERQTTFKELAASQSPCSEHNCLFFHQV